jgi:hypothetical protein
MKWSFVHEMIMNILDKILLFLSAILCGHCRKEFSEKKIRLRVYEDEDIPNS